MEAHHHAAAAANRAFPNRATPCSTQKTSPFSIGSICCLFGRCCVLFRHSWLQTTKKVLWDQNQDSDGKNARTRDFKNGVREPTGGVTVPVVENDARPFWGSAAAHWGERSSRNRKVLGSIPVSCMLKSP